MATKKAKKSKKLKKVRFGIIGAGSIAIYRHAPEIDAHPNGEILAICDIRPDRAEALAEDYGVEDVYTDYKDVLKRKDIDAVVVATPNRYHAPITIAALKAGKHVLCEKPMATSVADARKMIETAKDAGLKLMIGHNQRLMAPHVKAKELLDSGVMGRVFTFRTAFGHPGPEMWSQDKGPHTWFFKKEEAYVGSMGDLGVHKTDLVRWLLGEEIVEVGAFVETLDKKDENGNPITVDDNAVCILKSASGTVGQLTASWTYRGNEDNSTRLYCENGIMVLGEDPDWQVEVQFANGEIARYSVGAVATNEVQVESGIPRMFIDALLAGRDPEISGEEGLKALAIVVACLKSAKTKKLVKVEY